MWHSNTLCLNWSLIFPLFFRLFYSNVYWQLASLLRDGFLYCFYLLSELLETKKINQSVLVLVTTAACLFFCSDHVFLRIDDSFDFQFGNDSAVIGVTRGERGHAHFKISGISCCFVLREAVSHTKYCCSLKIKSFGPTSNFGLVKPLSVIVCRCGNNNG